MEIMSAHFSRFARLGAVSCGILLATGLQLFAQQSPAYARNLARFSLGARIDDNIAQVALISDHPTFGYTLNEGNSELVLSLSKIQNFDVISFLNDGATGTGHRQCGLQRGRRVGDGHAAHPRQAARRDQDGELERKEKASESF